MDFFARSPLEEVSDQAFRECLLQIKAFPLVAHLFPHQVDAAAFLASRQGAILADDMGLGKTRSALAATIFSQRIPALLITPTQLRRTWGQEIGVFGNYSICLPNSADEINLNCDFNIIPFSRLKSFVGYDFSAFRCLLVDEAHSFNNESRLYGRAEARMIAAISKGERARSCQICELRSGIQEPNIGHGPRNLRSILRCSSGVVAL